VKWLAVVNTAAGRAHEAEQLWSRVERNHPGLGRALTDGPGSGARIARAATDVDGLIVIGGDGTISECLTGMDLPRQRLAVLPAGHGNCLARDLGLHTANAALSALRQPHWRSLDLMDVAYDTHGGTSSQRLCASTLALGYVAHVVATGRARLPRLGRAAYAAAAFVTVPQRFRARAAVQGAARGAAQSLTGIVVNNTAHLANFRAFPDARIDDGQLDVMWQDHGWWRQQLHNCAVLVGSTAFGPRAMQQASHLQVWLDAPQSLMADGELLGGVTKLEVACRRAAVQCAGVRP
jgi:diacylglycerol kinase (ATP)